MRAPDPPVPTAPSPRPGVAVLAVSMLGLVATGLPVSILPVAVPELAAGLDLTPSQVTLLLSGSQLALALSIPVAGRLGDLHGWRRVYLAGLLAFLAATAASALAWNGEVLVSARLVASAAAAGTWPTSTALVLASLPPRHHSSALGWWSLSAAGAPVLGLLAGAPLLDTFGWRSLFAAQLPVGLAAVALATRFLPAGRAQRVGRRPGPPVVGGRLDLAGAVALAAAVAGGLLALDRGRLWGWRSPGVVAAAAAAVVAAAALVVVERRARDPFVPLALLRRGPVAGVVAARFLADLAYVGLLLAGALLLRGPLGHTAGSAATLLLVPTVLFAVAGPLFGHLEARLPRRAPSLAGLAAVAAGSAALAWAAIAAGGAGSATLGSGAPAWSTGLVVVGLAVAGLGLGAAGPFLAADVAAAATPAELGAAAAALQTASQVGGAVGVGVVGTLAVGATTPGPFLTAATVATASATAATLVAALALSRASRPDPAGPHAEATGPGCPDLAGRPGGREDGRDPT